jgi:hypothetical protein
MTTPVALTSDTKMAIRYLVSSDLHLQTGFRPSSILTPSVSPFLSLQNFRCSAAIVSASRMVIARNTRRRPKTIRTLAPFGVAVTVSECRNEACEAAEIAEAIQELVATQGLAMADIAVLYRLQRVGLDVMQGLRARGIACQSKGSRSGGGLDEGSGFSGSAGGSAFEDVLAVLTLVVNDSNDAACSQLLQTCSQHVGAPDDAALSCLNHLNLKKGMSLLSAVRAVRAHALGVMPSGELRGFPPGESLDATSATMNAMLAVLRIVATAKQEAQQLGCKDLVLNVLKQIAPYHENELLEEEAPIQGKKKGAKSQHGGRDGDRGSFAFIGIKALLKEADLFEQAESDTLPSALVRTPLRESSSAAVPQAFPDHLPSASKAGGIPQTPRIVPEGGLEGSPLRKEGVPALSSPAPLPRVPLASELRMDEASTSGRSNEGQRQAGPGRSMGTPEQAASRERDQKDTWQASQQRQTPSSSQGGAGRVESTPPGSRLQGSTPQSSQQRTPNSRSGERAGTAALFAGSLAVFLA